jgi:hypothetical protein
MKDSGFKVKRSGRRQKRDANHADESIKCAEASLGTGQE